MLRDLVVGAWPIGYGALDGDQSVLRVPLAYYLPAALIGKVVGAGFADTGLLIWTAIGVALFLALAVERATTFRAAIIMLQRIGAVLKRVLLNGATGFLGSKLLARMLGEPDQYEVTILKRSSSDTWRISGVLAGLRSFDIDRIRIRDVFSTAQYDVIVHCATDYVRRTLSRSDVIESNLLLPLRLLEAGPDRGSRTFIGTDTMLDKNVSDYTLCKRKFREWLQSLSGQVTGVNMVLEQFYGPGDNESKFVAHVIRSLLRAVPEIALTVGIQKRDFICVFRVNVSTDSGPTCPVMPR